VTGRLPADGLLAVDLGDVPTAVANLTVVDAVSAGGLTPPASVSPVVVTFGVPPSSPTLPTFVAGASSTVRVGFPALPLRITINTMSTTARTIAPMSRLSVLR